MNEHRYIKLTHWLSLHDTCAVLCFPLGRNADKHPEMRGRIGITIDTGDATVHLNPTAAETWQLIEALQWALAGGEARADATPTPGRQWAFEADLPAAAPAGAPA